MTKSKSKTTTTRTTRMTRMTLVKDNAIKRVEKFLNTVLIDVNIEDVRPTVCFSLVDDDGVITWVLVHDTSIITVMVGLSLILYNLDSSPGVVYNGVIIIWFRWQIISFTHYWQIGYPDRR